MFRKTSETGSKATDLVQSNTGIASDNSTRNFLEGVRQDAMKYDFIDAGCSLDSYRFLSLKSRYKSVTGNMLPPSVIQSAQVPEEEALEIGSAAP